MAKLSPDELKDRCKQLNSDNNSAVRSAENTKKTLDEISKKTWENVVKILSNKGQTPDQAFAELKATGKISEDVFKTIDASTAGLELLQKIDRWFSGVVATIDGVAYLGIFGYVKFVAKPGFAKAQAAKAQAAKAQAATAAAEEALAAFRARYVSRLLGPAERSIPIRTAQLELQLSSEALAAAEREALAANRLTQATKWSKRIGRFGWLGLVATVAVLVAEEVYVDAKEKEIANDIRHALHEIYTSRFYMTVQQKYLEFLVLHFSQVQDYTTLVLQGQQAAADILLHGWISHGVEMDPETGKVKQGSANQDVWSEEAVTVLLAKNDLTNKQRTDDDPTKEEMVKIHEEQLKKVQKKMEEDLAKAKAEVAAAKHN